MLVLLLVVWEAARRLGLGRAVVLQGPGAVWAALMGLLTGKELWPNFWVTIWLMLTASSSASTPRPRWRWPSA